MGWGEHRPPSLVCARHLPGGDSWDKIHIWRQSSLDMVSRERGHVTAGCRRQLTQGAGKPHVGVCCRSVRRSPRPTLPPIPHNAPPAGLTRLQHQHVSGAETSEKQCRTPHTRCPQTVRKRLYSAAWPHGEVTAWGGSGRPRLPPAAAVLVSWLETRRAADTVWMRCLSSGTPRGRQTLGKHRVVTHSGPTWTPSRFQLATARTPSCEHTRVGLLASHASAVSHVHLPKCCLCSSPEMLMGGRGAGARQPPRLGEPPPPVLPAAWGAGRWDGP